jgi:cell division topological specificity factor
MIDLLRWALQRQERSKDTARKRLQLILVLDRIGMAPEQMEVMKRDIIEVVSRYLIVEEESIELEIRRSDTSLILVSNIPVRDVSQTFVTQ